MVVDLARIVGAHGVSTVDADRFAYARDCWPRDLIRLRSGEVPSSPSCIVWPETAVEVAKVLALAAELGIAIVPYGAGSGVAGGARPTEGGITLDFKRMKAIRHLDEKNLRVEVEAGIMGERLERILEARGYTLGHFPSSIICSTLGGWLAARSAGQTSTAYGKIEDMTLGMEVVTPGTIRRLTSGPRPGPGPDFNALVIGSEGCLAAITAAELRIRRQPALRQLRGYQFSSVDSGLDAIRKILRTGVRPAVVRLYDALDTFIGRGHGKDDDAGDEAKSFELLATRAKSVIEDLKIPRELGSRLARSLVKTTVRAVLGSPMLLNRAVDALPSDCLLILGFEGEPALVAAEAEVGRIVCEGEGARDLGAGPGEHWYKNRHNVSFKQSKAYATGVFTDTMEVASTWDRLLPMYRAVRRAIGRDAFVMAHFSHAYPEGCSIYFTFAGASPDPLEPEATLARYDRIWKNALAAVSESGGTISHHHGIGILKAQAMANEHGPGGMRMLQALKRAFDLKGVMNPNKLGLSAARPRPTRRSVPPPSVGFPPEVVAAVGERNLIVNGARTTVRPPDESALAAVLRVANARGIAIATDQTGFRAARGAVRVDLSRFEGIVRLSTHSLFVEAEAGVRVERLEEMLGRHGLTLGRVHPRAAMRSVGAGLARNLLVRRSIAFGDLRDLCFAARGLLANGAPLETRPVPRSATGPEVDRSLVGCRGRWGIITRATLRVGVRPTLSECVAYRFDDLEAAINGARRTLRRGVRPSAGRVLADGVVALELVSSEARVLEAQRTLVRSVARELGGKETEAGDLAYGGKFDAVVEAATLWTRAGETLTAMKEAAHGETWVDFFAPEGATIVARVVDRDSRLAAFTAARACGAHVLAGSRQTDAGDAGDTADGTEKKHSSRPRTISVEEPPVWGPYEDIADRIADDLDPAGVFRGR